MTDEPDVALTVALAEYEHLREARRSISNQSTARFNFFLVIASAGTAVSAGLVSAGTGGGTGGGSATGGGLGTARMGAIAVIGVLILLLGIAVFARQVEFNGRSRRYAVAETALRTYLVRRSAGLAPYVLMPTLDDAGPFDAEPFRRHWFRDAVGLAGTVGVMNSTLLAVGGGLALRAVAPWWVAATAAAALMAAAVTAHVWYVRHRLAASVAMVGVVLRERPLAAPAAPWRLAQPAAPPAQPAAPPDQPSSESNGTDGSASRSRSTVTPP